LLLVVLTIGGARAVDAQISVGAARWLTDPSVMDYRLSFRRYWLGPIAIVPLANVAVQGPSGGGAFLIGGGGDAILRLTSSARPYLVGGLSAGFLDLRASVGVALWSGWSVGGGAELLRVGPIGLGPELRYQHLSREGTGGVSLGLRLGSAIGRSESRPSASGPSEGIPTTPRRSPAPERASPPPLATAAAPRTRTAATAAGIAREAMGTPYRWGGSDQNGFDCSGLIQYAYDQIGIKLPRSSREQALAGSEVPRAITELAPGDILVFADQPGTDRVSHVGLYLGDGTFIHSASGGVKTSSLADGDPDSRWWQSRWIGARRILD
jgi:cell wall-associated NlpC family hydrolase